MCFRCLIFSMSGPCEFVIFSLFYCHLDLTCGKCNLISLYVCFALSMDLHVLCVVCLNSLVKQFATCLGVVVIYYNIMFPYILDIIINCLIYM